MPQEREAMLFETLDGKPSVRPNNPKFSSGPTTKPLGWSAQELSTDVLGRSHRSLPARARIKSALTLTHQILNLPKDYRIGLLPGSDTGAFECAMWSLLGERGVDVLAWESFGAGWQTDITQHLAIKDVRVFDAPYGELPDLNKVSGDRDVVFTWNGTTSGARVPDDSWIDGQRTGLVLCDATSAVFAQPLPWSSLDVVTFSWQKCLGGEGAHGMVILSPRAVARLESWSPPRPLPKIFRLTKKGKLIEGIFQGDTINTPSLLCIEDYHHSLAWVQKMGGYSGVCARADANLATITQWVDTTAWVDFLVASPSRRSNTSVCLRVVEPAFSALPEASQRQLLKEMEKLLDVEAVAYDIGAYRDAPAGLRLWAGPTVENSDLAKLLPWLTWSFDTVVRPNL